LIGAVFFSIVIPFDDIVNHNLAYTQTIEDVPEVNFKSNQLFSYYNTTSFAGDAVLVDDYVFLATESGGLEVLDVSNPASPVNVDTYIQGASIYRIIVKDDLAYLSCGPDGLQIVNISDPHNVAYVSHLNWTYTQNPESTAQMEIVGNYLYVCDVDDDFKVINVTDPFNPIMIGSCFFSSSALGVAVKDNFAYIGAWNNRLVTVNITDPTDPQVTADNYSPISYSIGVQVKYGLVYVADWENGIHIYDLTNPDVPTFVKTISMEKLRDIYIFWQYAFVSDSDFGLRVFNLHDPLNPVLENTYSNGGYTSRVIVYEELTLVANGLNGLLIYDTFELIKDSLTITLPPETITLPPETITLPPETSTINQTITVTAGIFIGTSVFLVITGFTIAGIILRRKRK
jgi:hypothetical protein